MGQAVRGDFGNSFLTGEPAMRLILERMPATVELASVAMLLSVLIGVPLGILAGRARARLARHHDGLGAGLRCRTSGSG